MNIMIKATNIELTPVIKEYVEKRMEAISKFLPDSDTVVRVEVGKTTNHHKHGDFFKAEIDIMLGGYKFFAVSVKEDLYAAIDDAKEEIVRELTHSKDKEEGLFRRGARSIKKLMKGFSSRNPFTSKVEK